MKIAIIGCGVMGSALARHLAKKHMVALYDHHEEKSKKLASVLGAKASAKKSIKETTQGSDIVILAVKPKDLSAVAKEGGSAFKGLLVLSLLAGVSLASLKKELPLATPVRMISNLAMTAGKGVIGIVEEKAHTPAVKKKIEDALTGLGLLTFLPESKIEPLTALTASAPAFLLVLLEAMVDAGVTMGFSAAESTEFALQTMEGVVALVKESKKHPAQLKNDIASPAGMTIAGLNEMERLGARHAMTQAILAAFEKCKTLS